ncbi:MAG: putative lipid II flippase FtsW [Patescibacteria group bacterium]|nr:putative lipid II flippase FtsW [Patescibacteria group bacterium]
MKKFFSFFHFLFFHHRKNSHSHEKHGDRILLFSIFFLGVFGLVMVYNTSVPISIRDFGHPFHFIREQSMWFVIGLVSLFIVARIDYKVWYSACLPIMIATLLLLTAVFSPIIGIHVMGASRWVNLGFTTLQPSEFAKLAIVLYLAAWLSHKEKNRFGAFLIFLGATVGLVLLQPDMGTAIILMIISLSMYFASGSPIRQIAWFLPIVLIVFIVLALSAPYRLQRITTFLDPNKDPYGASYQIRQAILGVGSGGLSGVGLGMSRQKHDYLPEANTDAIFAIIAEELGFVGSSLLLLLFFFIIWRLFRIARRVPDTFSRLIVIGVVSWFGFQSAINIGAIISLLPLTGVPLPFVSYGGSSLVVLYTAFGIVLNITKYSK